MAPHMHCPDAWCPEPNPKPYPRYSRPARPSEARQAGYLAIATAAAVLRLDIDLAAGLEPRCDRSCCNRRVDNRHVLGDALDRVHAGFRLERDLLSTCRRHGQVDTEGVHPTLLRKQKW